MTTIATIEPKVFTAGDTVQWTKTLGDYKPADSWVLRYTFVQKSKMFQVTATDNGDGKHLATITAVTSASLLDGDYKWVATVTKAAERFTVAEGTVTVLPDLEASSEGRDTRTYEKRLLDAVEATMSGTATTDQASYSFDGVSITRMPWGELRSLRDMLKAEVFRQERAEKIRRGEGHTGKILVRFS